jgi:4-hydroxy-tetrahydrodipicolinate reductase
MIRVCVAGISGWVGRPVAAAIDETDDLALVAGVARGASGQRIGDTIVSASLADALESPFEVLVDYTSAEAAKGHAIDAARAGRHVVIGSSGLTTADYEDIDTVAREHAVGVVAVGNFAMTAAMLQRFAVEAAAYLPAWEIIDTASAGKRDAPSGMARELAWRLSQVRPPETEIPVDETVGAVDARGADIDGSRIHSVRLPGYTIGLEVRFGQADERLTISYDAGPGAGPYIAGTLLAIRRVGSVTGVVRGLDRLL